MTLKDIDTLLVIITEARLEKPLARTIMDLGATGYTICEVHGRGDRGIRNSELFEVSNIKIEVACKREVALAIKEYVSKTYGQNYATSLYMHGIEV